MVRAAGTMDVADFGLALLTTGDLDPVYILLHEAQLEPVRLRQWLITYFCFYHVGTASWCVDQPDYWAAMETAASSKAWPRCHERRHFRGATAMKSVAYLRGRGVDGLFDDLERAGPGLVDVCEAVKKWYGFGPWIAFKVADMLERLGLRPVSFADGSLLLYDSPRKGAEAVWARYGSGGPAPDGVGAWAADYLETHLSRVIGASAGLRWTPTHPNGPDTSRGILGGLELGAARCLRLPAAPPPPSLVDGRILPLAPPRYERPVNVQEWETVLCKWKTHLGGRYTVGEDVASCRSGLVRFYQCRTSQRLVQAGKRGGLW